MIAATIDQYEADGIIPINAPYHQRNVGSLPAHTNQLFTQYGMVNDPITGPSAKSTRIIRQPIPPATASPFRPILISIFSPVLLFLKYILAILLFP